MENLEFGERRHSIRRHEDAEYSERILSLKSAVVMAIGCIILIVAIPWVVESVNRKVEADIKVAAALERIANKVDRNSSPLRSMLVTP